MANINFDDGREKITINGDENRAIYVNLTDIAIFNRAMEAKENIARYSKELEEKTKYEEKAEISDKIDKYAREQVNYIFDSDVSDTVFGRVNVCSVNRDGKTCVEKFLDAILPVIESSMKKANTASKKRIEKYTKKYSNDSTRAFVGAKK